MTLAARLTQPLAALDAPLLAITDWGMFAGAWDRRAERLRRRPWRRLLG